MQEKKQKISLTTVLKEKQLQKLTNAKQAISRDGSIEIEKRFSTIEEVSIEDKSSSRYEQSNRGSGNILDKKSITVSLDIDEIFVDKICIDESFVVERDHLYSLYCHETVDYQKPKDLFKTPEKNENSCYTFAPNTQEMQQYLQTSVSNSIRELNVNQSSGRTENLPSQNRNNQHLSHITTSINNTSNLSGNFASSIRNDTHIPNILPKNGKGNYVIPNDKEVTLSYRTTEENTKWIKENKHQEITTTNPCIVR